MQLVIKLHPDRPLSLPLGYHHLLQSSLYHLMREDGLGYSIYHEKNPEKDKRSYGRFVFGKLHGPYRIEGKQIVFYKDIAFEVRSEDIHCLELIYNHLKQDGMVLGGQLIRRAEVTCCNRSVESEDLIIRMDSPVCVYRTDRETKKTIYWSPQDPEFADYINENFLRKYRAFYGENPESAIKVDVIDVNNSDKYVTRYKKLYITAWGGCYRLQGKREHLNFLYHTGLGSKNSQGFGLFEI